MSFIVYIIIIILCLYSFSYLLNEYKLFSLKKKIYSFVDSLQKDSVNHEYSKYINVLHQKIKKTVIGLNNGYRDEKGELFTSYTINKGEKMFVCMRNQNKNDVFYVILHELAHIACPEEEHTKLFNDIYKYLVTYSIKNNFYDFRDYKKNPVDHCGYIINENILKYFHFIIIDE